MVYCRSFIAIFLLITIANDGTAQSSPAVTIPAQRTQKVKSSATAISSGNDALESWEQLSIKGLHLAAVPPVIIQHSKNDAYIRDIVRVEWRTGDPIDLYVFHPIGKAKAPVILYLYSYPSDTDRFYDDGWARRVTASGYAAVGFVSALTGGRYHTRPLTESFITEMPEALATSVHDVQMVLNYLNARGDIDMDRVGMFGQGSGGTIAILAAQADSRIKALDVLNAWGDWADWLKDSAMVPNEVRDQLLRPDYLRMLAPLDPVRCLHGLSLANLRLQQVLDDAETPARARDALAAQAARAEMVSRFSDAAAHYEAVHADGVSGWLKSHMESPAPGVSSAAPVQHGETSD